MVKVSDLIEGAWYTISISKRPELPYKYNGKDMGNKPVFVRELGMFAFSKKLDEIPVTLVNNG